MPKKKGFVAAMEFLRALEHDGSWEERERAFFVHCFVCVRVHRLISPSRNKSPILCAPLQFHSICFAPLLTETQRFLILENRRSRRTHTTTREDIFVLPRQFTSVHTLRCRILLNPYFAECLSRLIEDTSEFMFECDPFSRISVRSSGIIKNTTRVPCGV
jgi:hypothetical protein